MMLKFFGALSIAAGLLFIFVFPGNIKHQPPQFTRAAALIGIILILLGVYLVLR